jgi:hypothetical protein
MAYGFKTGGRTKGTPNKATQITREIINEVADKLRPNLERDLAALDPKDRLQIWLKLVEFIVPKPQTMDMTLDVGKNTQTYIGDMLKKLAQENE